MSEESPTGVVVLERLPRAAGQTRWFRCTTPDALLSVFEALRFASRVSFYFDNRIEDRAVDGGLRRTTSRLLAEHGEIVVGILAADGIEVEVNLSTSESEVAEVLGLARSASRVFVGAWPAPDNDGFAAVTAIVPDADGTVRHEP